MHSERKDKGKEEEEREKEKKEESLGSTKAMKIPSIRLDYPEIPEEAAGTEEREREGTGELFLGVML